MNPRVSIFVFFTFILFSCSTEVKEVPVELAPAKTLASETDTFYSGRNLLCIADTSEMVFKKTFTSSLDTSESNNIKQNSAFVKRNGDTLSITLGNSKIKTLINEPYKEGADNLTEYKYLGKIRSIDYHLIYVGLYEAFTYLLINNKTGKETFLCGVPAVSPNKKYLAASCCDLQAGFVFNGIEMYDVESDSLKLNWKRELTKWGADELTWLDDHILILKKQRLDSASQDLVSSYIKLSCVGK